MTQHDVLKLMATEKVYRILRKMPKHRDARYVDIAKLAGLDDGYSNQVLKKLCLAGVCRKTEWGRYRITEKGYKLHKELEKAWERFAFAEEE